MMCEKAFEQERASDRLVREKRHGCGGNSSCVPLLACPAVRAVNQFPFLPVTMKGSEALACLVAAAVFKTVGPCDKRAAGRFDSDALPLEGSAR